MADPLPPFIHDLVVQWDGLAHYAFDGYLQHGRGMVGILRPGPEAQITFFPRIRFVDRGLTKIVAMIDAYDPDTEILLYYDATGGTRSSRLRMPTEDEAPRLVWIQRTLADVSEDPASLPEHAPPWFVELWRTLAQKDDANGGFPPGSEPWFR